MQKKIQINQNEDKSEDENSAYEIVEELDVEFESEEFQVKTGKMKMNCMSK